MYFHIRILYIDAYTNAHIHICVTHIFVCLHVCMYVCVCACVCMRVRVYTYIRAGRSTAHTAAAATRGKQSLEACFAKGCV